MGTSATMSSEELALSTIRSLNDGKLDHTPCNPASRYTSRKEWTLKVSMSILLMFSLVVPLHAQDNHRLVKSEVLLQTTSPWDGSEYAMYPRGHPQLSVLKVTIPPHTALDWHSHPMPNAAYVISGELTLETRRGKSRSFKAGDAIAETVNVVHRGISGSEATVLIVFYAGTPSLPLTRPVRNSAHQDSVPR
jgi:quercetin dioxygenase-like cupin family protein